MSTVAPKQNWLHNHRENKQRSRPRIDGRSWRHNRGDQEVHAPFVMTKELPTGARWKIWLNLSGFASPSGYAHRQERRVCEKSGTSLPSACHGFERQVTKVSSTNMGNIP